jgi:hypothetical protein
MVRENHKALRFIRTDYSMGILTALRGQHKFPFRGILPLLLERSLTDSPDPFSRKFIHFYMNGVDYS